MKVGVFGEELQFLIQNFEAFLRDFVRRDVVYRDLQPFQAGAIQLLNTVGGQQIAIRDQSGDDAVFPDAANDLV